MTEAARIIEQHYGVKVVLDKMVQDKKVSGILANDNLDVLLKALEATQDFTIIKKDNTIHISNPEE
jgi:ferric-dicitrate binding protein FerR (iron transport regulator)